MRGTTSTRTTSGSCTATISAVCSQSAFRRSAGIISAWRIGRGSGPKATRNLRLRARSSAQRSERRTRGGSTEDRGARKADDFPRSRAHAFGIRAHAARGGDLGTGARNRLYAKLSRLARLALAAFPAVAGTLDARHADRYRRTGLQRHGRSRALRGQRARALYRRLAVAAD